MRASVSRTEAAAISEYGPPSWNAASVSVKLTQVKAGTARTAPVLAAPDPAELVDGGVVDERGPPVVLARADESLCGVG